MIEPLQAALEAVDKYVSGNKHPESAVLRARVRAMLRAYHECWGQQNLDYEVLFVEKMLLAPLKNLLTGKESGYLAGGKLDVGLREKFNRKRMVLMDHKFLAWQFENEDIEHLLVTGQLNQYGYLGWYNGIKFEAAAWDVIAKSKHVPRKESARIVRPARPERIAARKQTIDGVEYKKGDPIPPCEEVRERTPAETMEEFEERVFGAILDSKDKYFARPVVPIVKSHMADHVHELYMWTKELDMDSRGDTHLRNTDACMDHNHACEYLGLCLGKSSEDDGTWKKRGTVHAELELPEGVDPFKIITNSRVGMYKRCRLRHHRRYNIGLVKTDDAPVESLYVGSAGHVGLEAYWKAIALHQGKVL